jgi:hypothetical protein
VTERYTADGVRARVEADIERLCTPWAAGRPPTWVPDPATRWLVATGYWLDEELARVCDSVPDRWTQKWKFNRLSRSHDVWETAAECLNDVLDGKVVQGYRCNRRWG